MADAPPSPWDSDGEEHLSELASAPPSRTPPPTPPSGPIYSLPHSQIPPPRYSSSPPTPTSMPPQICAPSYSTPPPKIIQAYAETPPLAKATDPITPRTEQWLTQSLESLNGYFDMGWARYQFAMRRRGQVALWQGGQWVYRSQFLDRSLKRARLILAASAPRLRRLQPSLAPPLPPPPGQTTSSCVLTHKQTSMLPLRASLLPIVPPPTTTTPTRPYPREAAPSVEPGYAHFDSDCPPQTQTTACFQPTVPALSTCAATRCTRAHLFPSLETHPSGKVRARFFCSVYNGIMPDSSLPLLPAPFPIASANAPAYAPATAPVVLSEVDADVVQSEKL